MSSTAEIVLPENLRLELATTGPVNGDWLWKTDADSIIVRAERPIDHAEPVASALLAAWAAHQRGRGKKIVVDDSLKSVRAWRLGLLSSIAGRPSTSQVASFVPPTRVPSPEQHQALFKQIRPLLNLKDENQAGVLLHCLGEMLRNVHEHARCNEGAFVSCSYFPEAERVSLAVVDTGIGVPADIRRKHGMELTDPQALKVAVQFRVSGASATAENAGIGLFYARSAAIHTGGRFSLISGEGQIVSSSPDSEDASPVGAGWKGTIVALMFRPSHAHRIWDKTGAVLAADLDNRKNQPVQWGPPTSAEALMVKIEPTTAGLVEDKQQAQRLRREMILPALVKGRHVAIDLRSAKVITHSFVHALLHEPFKMLGARSNELISVEAKEAPIKDIIRIVARYAREEDTPNPGDAELDKST